MAAPLQHGRPGRVSARRLSGRAPGAALLVTACALIAAVFALPLGYLVARNLAGGQFLAVVTGGRTAGPLARSVLLATTVTVSAAVLGTTLAWLVERTDLPGRRAWRLVLPLPLVIPSFIGAFALVAAFATGGLVETLLAPLGVRDLPRMGGFWGAFAVLVAFTYPYVYLPAAARLRQLPASLEESARLLGRTPAVIFATVVWPQVRDAVWAGSLLVFLYALSDFGAVALLRYDTLTRAVYATRLDPPTSLGLSLLLGLGALAVVAIERAVGRGRSPAAPVGAGRPLQVTLGRWKAAAGGLLATVVGLALVAPAGVLIYWAVRGLVRGSGGAGALFDDVADLAVPALNSARLGIMAALTAALVVTPVAYLTVRGRTRFAGLVNAVVVGGFALPGLVVALALVFWTLQGPAPAAVLYQTVPLLVIAYVVHFGAQALRTVQVGVAGIPPRADDVARTLGAGRVRRLLTVDLPLALPSILAGSGLVLLSTMKELPLTLLLARPGVQTLATKIWTANEDAFLADASLAALLLLAVSGLLTWLLVLRQAQRLA